MWPHVNMLVYLNTLLVYLDFLTRQLPFVISAIGVLWAIHCINSLLGKRLAFFGIIPRRLSHLPGIVLCPFIHKDFEHLISNSIPLFFLMNAVLFFGTPLLLQTTLFIVVSSGTLIWLFGRPGIHIGASALVMGYFGFIIASACIIKAPIVIITAVLCFFYLSGLLVGLLPIQANASWEGHLFGFSSGILYAMLYFRT